MVDHWGESPEERKAREARERAAYARRRTRREQDLGQENRTLINPERQEATRQRAADRLETEVRATSVAQGSERRSDQRATLSAQGAHARSIRQSREGREGREDLEPREGRAERAGRADRVGCEGREGRERRADRAGREGREGAEGAEARQPREGGANCEARRTRRGEGGQSQRRDRDEAQQRQPRASRSSRETREERDQREFREARQPRVQAQPSGRKSSQDRSRESARAQRKAVEQGRAVRRSVPGSVDYNNLPSDNNAFMAKKKKSVLPKIIIAALIVALLGCAGYFGYPLVKQVLSGASPAVEGPSDENMDVQDSAVGPISITLTFAGDCTLGTDANFNKSTSLPAMYDEQGDPAYFMANVYDIFSTDDLTVVNLEGTLTDSGSRVDKQFAFKGDPAYTGILTSGDIEAVSLANNHSKDYGEVSYTDTIAACDAAGVASFGYDRIAYVDVKGVKVALIGTYELALHEGIKDEMVANITEARAQGAQLVIVYTHWGNEREYVPNGTQMRLGHAAIDAGADLVVGSHPHVIQGYEVYKDRYIVYSLGNFCFGGNSNPSDKDCMIFQQTFTVTGDEVALDKQVKIIPCSISSTSSRNNYQPTPAEGSEADRIMAKIQDSSDQIAANAAAMG